MRDRFEYVDWEFRLAVDEDHVLVLDNATGVAYLGHCDAGTGWLQGEVAELVGCDPEEQLA
jgi:hypothetical protein